jgi:hypothetical protein
VVVAQTPNEDICGGFNVRCQLAVPFCIIIATRALLHIHELAYASQEILRRRILLWQSVEVNSLEKMDKSNRGLDLEKELTCSVSLARIRLTCRPPGGVSFEPRSRCAQNGFCARDKFCNLPRMLNLLMSSANMVMQARFVPKSSISLSLSWTAFILSAARV